MKLQQVMAFLLRQLEIFWPARAKVGMSSKFTSTFTEVLVPLGEPHARWPICTHPCGSVSSFVPMGPIRDLMGPYLAYGSYGFKGAPGYMYLLEGTSGIAYIIICD